jgi:hypothetical protein
MGGDRSVSAGGNIVGSAIVTGDHSTAQANLVAVGAEDALVSLAAIRQVFAALPDLDRKALRRLDVAADELRKPEPDRKEVKDLLVQATGYARKATGFAKAVEGLAPHVGKLGGWLGQVWGHLSDLMDL